MPDDLTDHIADAAQEPAEASVDGQTVKAVPIADKILADQYAKAQDAVAGGDNAQGGPRSGWGMLRPSRQIPPGAQ